MTTRLRQTAAAAVLNRLWSLVHSGGSLLEGVWRARHHFLVGLTFFHVVIIALAGPVLGKQLELSFRALFDDGSALRHGRGARGCAVRNAGVLATSGSHDSSSRSGCARWARWPAASRTTSTTRSPP